MNLPDPLRGGETPRAGSAEGEERYVLVNAAIFLHLRGVRDLPNGAELFRVPHPQAFRPYQYDQFAPEHRRLLRSADTDIRLLDTRPELPPDVRVR